MQVTLHVAQLLHLAVLDQCYVPETLLYVQRPFTVTGRA